MKYEEIKYQIDNLVKAAKKEANRTKYCLHPQNSDCKGRIVKAHAIQNNRILTKLAVNGIVQTMDGNSIFLFQDAQNKGRKIATTFSGFCEYHDKTTFQEIEDNKFLGSEKQIFLFTYRTFAWHYLKKKQQIDRDLYVFNKLEVNSPDIEEYRKNLSICQRDNEYKKNFFDNCLLEKCYSKVSSIIWEIPYRIYFSISSMLEIEYDILGNQLNNIYSDQMIKSIYLNIFPDNEKSYCLWSWDQNDDDLYQPFSEQFMRLDIIDRENYLNNYLPRESDSFVFSPRLWEKWGEEIQNALITHSNLNFLYREIEELEKKYAYTYMDVPWNFFEKLQMNNKIIITK